MNGFQIINVRGLSDTFLPNGTKLPPGSSCCSPAQAIPIDLPGRRLATPTRAKLFEDLASPEGKKSFPIPHVAAYAGLSALYHEKAERDILSREAGELVDFIFPRSKVLIEFIGGQPSIAASYILAGIENLGVNMKYYAISSSSTDILKAFSLLDPWKYKHIDLIGLHGSYEDACDWLALNEKMLPKTVLWLSHSVASFDRIDVALFLRRITAHLLIPGDFVMIGTERRDMGCVPVLNHKVSTEKDKGRVMENLLRAYGLYFESARETFSTMLWDIHDEYDRNIGARRSYIVARRNIQLNHDIMVKAGERILMEQSWKYDDGDIGEMLRYTGLDLCFTYTDGEDVYDLRVLTLSECKTPKHFGAMKAYFDQKRG